MGIDTEGRVPSVEPDRRDGTVIVVISVATVAITLLVLLFGLSVAARLGREVVVVPASPTFGVQTPLPPRPGAGGPTAGDVIVPPNATPTPDVPPVAQTELAATTTAEAALTPTGEETETPTLTETPEGEPTATDEVATPTEEGDIEPTETLPDPDDTPTAEVEPTATDEVATPEPLPTAEPTDTPGGYPGPATPTPTPEAYP